MSMRNLVVALSVTALLSLFGCGGGDDTSSSAGDEAPAADAGGEAASDEAPAEAAPAETAAASGGDIKGTWSIALGPEEQAQLDAAKAAVESNPEDAMAKSMVEMMEAMLTSMTLTVTADKMTMAMGDQSEEVSYSSTEAAGATVLTTTDSDGKTESVNVSWDGDVMVWTKDGEEKAMRWQRK